MYVIIWEFEPRSGSEKEFEEAYGPRGVWVKFFGEGKGYIRTELLRDASDPRRYITIDYWASQESYESFRRQYADEYKAIDAQCETLSERESHVGSFSTRAD